MFKRTLLPALLAYEKENSVEKSYKAVDINELKKSLDFIKTYTNLPIVPGFGIKNASDVKNICKFADGAVVGSSIIKIVEENLKDKVLMIKKINDFVKELKRGTII